MIDEKNRLLQTIGKLVQDSGLSRDDKQTVLVSAVKAFQAAIGQPEGVAHLTLDQMHAVALQAFGAALGDSAQSVFVILHVGDHLRCTQITHPRHMEAGEQLRQMAPAAMMQWLKDEGLVQVISFDDLVTTLQAKASGVVQ
jgi:hypothetical protein